MIKMGKSRLRRCQPWSFSPGPSNTRKTTSLECESRRDGRLLRRSGYWRILLSLVHSACGTAKWGMSLLRCVISYSPALSWIVKLNNGWSPGQGIGAPMVRETPLSDFVQSHLDDSRHHWIYGRCLSSSSTEIWRRSWPWTQPAEPSWAFGFWSGIRAAWREDS